MTIDDIFFGRLSGYAPLSALVGDRIFPDAAPQGVDVPYIVWDQITEGRESGMGSDIGIVDSRRQLNVFAATDVARHAIKQALLGALQRWESPLTNPKVFDCFILDWSQNRDPETDLFAGRMDIRLHHSE